MTDILGGAGIYFDPVSVPSIAAAIETLLRDQDLRGRLAARASDRSEAYSWRRCSADTFAFIASVISENPASTPVRSGNQGR
jgi:glycosyltransferase involved in cell wall biosynthesis